MRDTPRRTSYSSLHKTSALLWDAHFGTQCQAALLSRECCAAKLLIALLCAP